MLKDSMTLSLRVRLRTKRISLNTLTPSNLIRGKKKKELTGVWEKRGRGERR